MSLLKGCLSVAKLVVVLFAYACLDELATWRRNRCVRLAMRRGRK